VLGIVLGLMWHLWGHGIDAAVTTWARRWAWPLIIGLLVWRWTGAGTVLRLAVTTGGLRVVSEVWVDAEG
jgi:hypothetical protein